MLSQTGNLQDPVAYTGIEPHTGPDSSSKQDFIHPPSLSSDMGLRYMTIPTTDDLR
ncbi:hypothetical protein F5884DRAFT_680049 [Xylogone sp. PMI_703]|nr:hypothetical protein F5884DRAFT_680049 [Xylogone sp. PMI_703]